MIHPRPADRNPQDAMLPGRDLRDRPSGFAGGHAGGYTLLHSCASITQRKADLVAFGNWAVITGRGWLVRAVETALAREGLERA
jgi:hypothetical protein